MKSKLELKQMFTNNEWNSDTLRYADEVINKLNDDTLKLSIYPNQYEIVTAEQMLDAYSLIGLPTSYNHWKFGKSFAINESKYKRGQMGLSYEMIINSNPCISYNMEENTTCLMLLVMAHAGIGHNAFFKNNYLFKQWTQADAIIDYMVFAKKFVSQCEEKYGYEEVEAVLDACHALMQYGVSKYKKPYKMDVAEESGRVEKEMSLESDIWRTVPKKKKDLVEKEVRFPESSEENILYFIEKNSPILEDWQRELVRIVRKTAQYFYPQSQTKVANEGCLVEGSLINTEDGLLDIKYIVDNKYQGNVWDGSNWRKIYDWFEHRNRKRIRISTDKGIILHGGDEHKIFDGNDWKKINELNIGDKIKLNISESKFTQKYQIINYKKPYKHTIKEVCEKYNTNSTTYQRFLDENYKFNLSIDNKLKCEKVKNFLESEKDLPNYSSKWVNYKLPNILDEDLAYWLGLLIGDGNTNINSRIITLTNGDIDLVNRFIKLTKSIFNYDASVKKEDNKFRVNISSQLILHFIHNSLNIKNGKSSRFKEVPKLILLSPKSVVTSFIKGHFDADGCSSGHIVIVSNSEKLLMTEQQLLLKMGIMSSVKKSNQDDTYRLSLNGKNIKLFNDLIGTYSKSKQSKLDEILENKKYFINKDYYITITDIEIDYGITYDFSVESTHKYISNGVINHNCATFTHYHLIEELHKQDYVDEGFMMEFYHHHSNVIFQPGFDSPYYSGMNPYTLGFNILMDVKRMCINPTDEDKEWFPNVVNTDWVKTFHHIVENYKDDSFIAQYLSPNLIREMRMFGIEDIHGNTNYTVNAIHNETGYLDIRDNLSDFYNRSRYVPDIQVFDVDLYGDRTLTLKYTSYDSRELQLKSAKKVLSHLTTLWGFPVRIVEGDDNVEIYSTKND